METEAPPEHRQYFRLVKKRDRVARWERSAAVWMQGWTFIVIAAFVARAIWVFDWEIVAWIALGQTALLAILILLSHWKWRVEIDRRRADRKIAGTT